MRNPGWGAKLARMRKVLITTLLLFLLIPGAGAAAATVAYLDQGEVRLASDDGTRKRTLAGPTADGRVWLELAQADNGRVLAVRREPNKIAPLNTFTLWGPGGDQLYEGSLKVPPGWSTSAFPVSLDLTADGRNVVYGYSNTSGFYPNTIFETGTYVMYADRTPATEPFRIAGRQWPTTAGDRLVVAEGGIISTQSPAPQAPYGTDFDPWIDTAPTGLDLQRTDVSANGAVAAAELVTWNDGEMNTGKIAMLPVGTLGGELQPGDCFLPTQGVATDATMSADGKLVAWHDDRGIVVAGKPDFSGAEPCVLTRAPVVISATGTRPSFGSASLGGDGPGPGPGPGTGPGPGPGGGDLKVTLPVRVAAKGLRRGIVVKVRVKRAGLVKVAGRVGGKLVATGQRRAARAGVVKVKLKATAKYRDRLADLAGETLKLKVTGPGGTTVIKRRLR